MDRTLNASRPAAPTLDPTPSVDEVVAGIYGLVAELDREDGRDVFDWQAFEAAEDEADAAIFAMLRERRER